MDDRGYLIAHTSLIEPNGKGPVEKQHITNVVQFYNDNKITTLSLTSI
jgi:hypothetical protein